MRLEVCNDACQRVVLTFMWYSYLYLVEGRDSYADIDALFNEPEHYSDEFLRELEHIERRAVENQGMLIPNDFCDGR